MKDEFRQFSEKPDKEVAAQFLDAWIRRAKASDFAVLKQLGRTMENHRYGLLAWYGRPISTAPLEGTNNKIKTLQSRLTATGPGVFPAPDLRLSRVAVRAGRVTVFP